MGISSSALLVDASISVWTANKLDKAATSKVLMDNNVTANNGAQVRKNLMAGTSLLKDISDFAAQTRLWHNKQTLAWMDRGARLVPTSSFIDYKQEMSRREAKFWGMVDKFVNEYPNFVQISKNHLGTLAKDDDYPTTDEIRNKFAFSVVFTPVPESGDFRVDVAQEDLKELKEQYESSFDNRVKDAMKEAWDRLHDLIKGMSDKLRDEESADGTEVKKRYHGSLITNATELCAMLTHLNITKDPQLESARQDLERAMYGVDIDDIKESVHTRRDVKTKLDNILNQYSW